MSPLVQQQMTLLRIIERRGWASAEALSDFVAAIEPGLDVNAVLQRLMERRLIDRHQGRELLLADDDPQEVDQYRLLGKLGSGAMGSVFLGEDPATGCQVAIKVIHTKHVDDEEFVSRFHREIEMVTQLDHPHIARAVGVGKLAGELYLAMEYIDGPSFSDLLRAHGPLPEAYLLRLAIQVCQGLDYAYQSQGLIHRDIKPENVLIVKSSQQHDNPGDDDAAKIIDFGLAKAIHTDQSLTMTGLTMGTPHYMSPEQICGKKDLDCRTDIYGLGCTLYHLLTGSTPFKGDSPGGIMMAHVNEQAVEAADRVPSLHELTNRLICTAMSKDREERYLNFKAFIQAAEGALQACTGSREGKEVRLLRKPLVLNRTSPRTSDRRKKPGTECKPLVGTDPAVQRREVTDRIIRKHAERDGGSQSHSGSGSGSRAEGGSYTAIKSEEITLDDPFDAALEPRSPSAPAGGKASEALRKIQTSRQSRSPRSDPLKLLDRKIESSAVFKTDVEAESGSGILPWIVFVIAMLVLGLVVFSIY